MKIDDAENVVEGGLLINPSFNRAEIVAKVEVSGRLNPRKTLWRIVPATAVGCSVNANSPVAPAVTTIPPWTSISSFLNRNGADYSQAPLCDSRRCHPSVGCGLVGDVMVAKVRLLWLLSQVTPNRRMLSDDAKRAWPFSVSRVLHAWRHLRKARPVDDACFLESTQAIRECLGADFPQATAATR